MRQLLAMAAIAAALGAGPCEPGTDPHSTTPPGNVALMDLADQDGYRLSGPHGFSGELLWQEDNGGVWRLAGTFAFPTAGYEVGTPDITIKKSLPEQVHILLTLTPPPPGALVAQVITEIPVEAEMRVDRNAAFEIEVTPAQPAEN